MAEASAYDASLERWHATIFEPVGRIVLNLKKLNEYEPLESGEIVVGVYEAWIGRFGDSSRSTCYGYGLAGGVEVWGSTLSCAAGPTRYTVNLEAMRFLESFQVGFVDGIDEEDSNTPYMMGGTCAKIE